MLRGKVARVLDSRKVAINIGSTSGVSVGMKFDIMSDQKEDIHDPDTNDILGSLDRPKARVLVSQVADKFAIASTYRKTSVNVGGMGLDSPFARVLSPPNWIEKVETLRTREQTWEDLDESERYIKTGDAVVQVLRDT